MTAAPTLTPRQLDELRKIFASGPRESRGKGRVRVHNNLRRLGLVEVYSTGRGFMCATTQAGRAFLKGVPEKRDTWVRGVLVVMPSGPVSVGGALLSDVFKDFDGKKVRVKLDVIT